VAVAVIGGADDSGSADCKGAEDFTCVLLAWDFLRTGDAARETTV
jgi:hypothetical protein